MGHGDDLAALRAAAKNTWNVILDFVFGELGLTAFKTSAMGARMESVDRMSSPSMTVELV